MINKYKNKIQLQKKKESIIEFQFKDYSCLDQKKFKCTPSECTICLIDYTPEEYVTMIKKCGHIYHSCCISEWLDIKHTCPVCKVNLH